MFRITRKYLLRLMLGVALLPVTSCTAHPTKEEKTTEAAVKVTQDEAIFKEKMAIAAQSDYVKLPIGERVVAMGKTLLGIPYVGGTLEVDSLNESLVTNLRGLDCVTFYENSLAMARTIKLSNPPGFQAYRSQLALLRYRGGDLDGFASRLHYTSDYFFDSEKKGLMRNVTREIAGSVAVHDTRTISFMSTHRSAYKQLKASDEQFAQIKAWEDTINARGGYYYIPKGSVAQVEKGIQNGDILGIVTSINGLDFSHTGIAVKGDDGRIHFMHASSALGKVVISDLPLSDYLASNGKQIGVVVMRPIEVSIN
jgi:hypothetical protein